MHYYFYFFPGQNCTKPQPIAMKEITVAMQNKTKVDIRMSSNPLLEVLRTQFLLNCNTFIFRSRRRRCLFTECTKITTIFFGS